MDTCSFSKKLVFLSVASIKPKGKNYATLLKVNKNAFKLHI